MSNGPGKQVGDGGEGRKRSRVVRYFDWRKSDPKKYAGLNDLTDELITYKENLSELLPRTGDFVLIKGREVIGVFADPEDALAKALDRFPGEQILIKKIVAKEPIHSLGGAVS